jgi:hypothetical protein
MRGSILWMVATACSTPPVATTPPSVSITWSNVDRIDALRFCPGDAELIAFDDKGNLRRFRTRDGVQLAITHLGNAEYPAYPIFPPIECRADGVALAIALDAVPSPVLVDARGAITRPPRAIRAHAARFAADGGIAVLADDGTVTRWAGSAVTVVMTGREHAYPSALVQGGARLEYDEHVNATATAEEGSAWLVGLDGTRAQLHGTVTEFARAELAPDGGIVATDNMAAWEWNVQNGVRAHATLLLDTNQQMITSLAASNRWFVALGRYDTLTVMDRRSGTKRDVKAPCGAGERVYAVAIAGDDARFALSCDSGVHIVDAATLLR